MAFADHFSEVAAAYARYRPRYPDALGAFLASVVPGRALCWDCGTGNGQAATMLARHVEQVVATDPSPEQLKNAEPHPRVEYRLGRESQSGLPGASCDLATSAQAVHWFDLPAYYREVDRVLKPGGVLALWGCARTLAGPDVDPLIWRFQNERLRPYWPPGRELIDAEYRTLPFPYPRIETPAFNIEMQMDPTALSGSLGTWSAVQRCRDAEGVDPVSNLMSEIEAVWPPGEVRTVRLPITLLAGRKA